MAECVCNEIFDDGTDITRPDGQPTYRGRAKPGVGIDEAGWQIVKFSYSAADEVVQIIYADGDPGFVHVYDDGGDEYTHYTYSFTGS